jgi:quercetin dioxygenase-like cupin family protein
MTKSAGLLAALLFLAFVLAGVVANPALAQEKKMDKSVQKAAAGHITVKEIDKNDKLHIFEVTFKPGDVAPSAKRPMRVIHVLKGGTIERTYDGGTKETEQYKTGDTKLFSDEKTYAVKNIGKGVVRLLVVEAK